KAAQALVDQAQQEYNVAYKEAKFGYVEVAGKDEAMVLTSNTDGQFQISGLAAGTYKLEEIKAPEGFAKIDDVEFVVGAGSWNQGEFNYLKDVQKNDATKVVNKKITIPQTGGIGTIIFAVAGAAIMGIAVYAYVKNNKDEDQLA
ncbi:SpaA isopeptide-forming pilin-related protein, partial [Streptococcus pneumoniae]|uniref:SpaA isopeptide-forming pilin-related protein n=1 Tax=Streptococcus pneumoniae TaxID=1313 RepID=UPI000A46510D